jgi:hypothetical protein
LIAHDSKSCVPKGTVGSQSSPVREPGAPDPATPVNTPGCDGESHIISGRVPERTNGAVSKTAVPFGYPGFESQPFRLKFFEEKF